MKLSPIVLIATAMTVVFQVGCAAPAWDRQVRQWGELRAVLHEGQTEPRIRLADVLNKPHAYGVGALAGLTGEITILDSAGWTARADGPQRIRTSPAATDDQATLLAVAYVPRWREHKIEHAVSPEQFDQAIREIAIRAGLDPQTAFPFVVAGRFPLLDLHVVNGSCPVAAADAAAETPNAPVRRHFTDVSGTLVGFYAENAAGRLTHHDTQTHVHALLGDPERSTGHVDAVGLAAGAVVRVPDLSASR